MHARLAAISLAIAVSAAQADAAEVSDVGRGRALYENHCQVCHTSQVHSRINRLPISVAELQQIVTGWARQENLRWTDQDVRDVVGYLNQTRYHFQQ